jgi:hypothetical protein
VSRRRRAVAQLLDRPAGSTTAGVVRHLVGVQAQDARSARLALRARLGAAPVVGDDLVVTWLMRGTLHLVHRDDLDWLHAATGGVPASSNARRLRALAVNESEAEAAVATIRGALPFTRSEAGGLLGRSGQAVPHLLLLASMRGVCVQDLDGRFTAMRLAPVDRAAALDELARRYAVAHPEATREDLAVWSGLPKRDVRPLPEAPDDTARVPPVPPRLLPAFDPYLLGWRDRSFAVPEALRARVFPGGGMFRATAVDDGLVRGTWTVPRGRVVLDPADLAERFADEVAGVEAALAAS